MSIRKQSIKSLADGISRFENSENAVKKSDFSDFKQFLKNFLNTPEPMQRKKLAEEFRKRHLELYEFLKNNGDLISAETEIFRTIRAVFAGEKTENDSSRITNLLEMIEKSAKNDIQ